MRTCDWFANVSKPSMKTLKMLLQNRWEITQCFQRSTARRSAPYPSALPAFPAPANPLHPIVLSSYAYICTDQPTFQGKEQQVCNGHERLYRLQLALYNGSLQNIYSSETGMGITMAPVSPRSSPGLFTQGMWPSSYCCTYVASSPMGRGPTCSNINVSFMSLIRKQLSGTALHVQNVNMHTHIHGPSFKSS